MSHILVLWVDTIGSNLTDSHDSGQLPGNHDKGLILAYQPNQHAKRLKRTVNCRVQF